MAQDKLKGLRVSALSKRIGDFVLEADFSVAPGERLVVQAPSGTGKTSLLRMIAGLERADQGQLFLEGREITTLAPSARDIGVVFQDPALFDAMNVFENAAFGLRMRGVGREERRREALSGLAQVGLGDKADHSVRTLSGGEKQRIAFVRALIWRPRLLLLDEPFSALDSALRQGLRMELKRLLEAHPVPMILVTHDREDAEALATSHASISVGPAGFRRFEKKVGTPFCTF